jgi:hypothetical protein
MEVKIAVEEAEAEFKPLILAFRCNWRAYAGADLTGIIEQLKNKGSKPS